MTEKNIIRDIIRNFKKDISNNEKKNASNKVFKKLYSLEVWKKSNKILFYHSLPDELQTIEYLQFTTDKELYLPRVKGNTLEILPYSSKKIDIGKFNIHEPTGNDIVSIENIDLVIVPAMAFDKQCNRLGRGKGYYDSILSNSNAIKIGIGYDFQVFDKIPTEPHDIKMDIIITPSYTIYKDLNI